MGIEQRIISNMVGITGEDAGWVGGYESMVGVEGVNNLLASRNLRPYDARLDAPGLWTRMGRGDRYCGICVGGTQGPERVFVKALFNTPESEVDKIKREISALRLITGLRDAGVAIHTPRLLEFSGSGEKPYYIMEPVTIFMVDSQGERLDSRLTRFPSVRRFASGDLNRLVEEIHRVNTANLRVVQSHLVDAVSVYPLTDASSLRRRLRSILKGEAVDIGEPYLLEFKTVPKLTLNQLSESGKLGDKLSAYIEEDSDWVGLVENTAQKEFLVHGDCHRGYVDDKGKWRLGNIFFDNAGNAVLLDWEWATRHKTALGQVYDVAFLYHFLWDSPDLQRRLMESWIKADFVSDAVQERKLMRLGIIFVGLDKHLWRAVYRDYKHPFIQERYKGGLIRVLEGAVDRQLPGLDS